MAKTLSDVDISVLLLGMALSGMLSSALLDLTVLFFYKTIGIVGQSLMSAFVVTLISLIAMFVYLHNVPTTTAASVASVALK